MFGGDFTLRQDKDGTVQRISYVSGDREYYCFVSNDIYLIDALCEMIKFRAGKDMKLGGGFRTIIYDDPVKP